MMSLAISSPAVCSFAQRTSVAKLQVQQEDVAQKLGEDMYNRETPPTFRLAGGSLTPAFQIWCFALQKSFAETFSLFEARSDSNRGTPPEKMQKWSATSAEEVLPHPCVAVARVWGSVGSSWDQLETLKSTQGKFGSPWNPDPGCASRLGSSGKNTKEKCNTSKELWVAQIETMHLGSVLQVPDNTYNRLSLSVYWVSWWWWVYVCRMPHNIDQR